MPQADVQLFESIDHDLVADAVVQQIERLIVSGVLKGGQKLPSEREMAELMGVSRPKLRDAIKVLEERGLVTVRHGDGTFVARLTAAALTPAMIELLSRHRSAFYDYLEFRREVEGFASFAAAQRATEADREILRGLIAEMERAHADADTTREAELDTEFHIAVVDAAHNSMLIQVMASIYELMSRRMFHNRRFLYELPDARDALLDQHRAIADAVIGGDPERAARAAEEHIDFVEAGFRDGEEAARREGISRKRLVLSQAARPRGRRG